MKKFMAMLATVLLSLSSCSSHSQLGAFNDLPASAQSFVNTYYSESEVAFVKVEGSGLFAEYSVHLNSGVEIEFDHKGNLTEIDCRPSAVPDGIVPQVIVNYVASKFPNAFIVAYHVDRHDQKVDLSNSLELEFDKNGNFLRIDD